MSTEFIAESERRVIAIQNEIAHLEEIRWRSTAQEQRLDLLRQKLEVTRAALDHELDQISLIEEEA